MAFAQNPTVFYWCQLAAGFFGISVTNSLYISVIDNSNSRLREIFTVVYNLGYPVGIYALSQAFDVFQQWKNAQLVLAGISLVLLLMFR